MSVEPVKPTRKPLFRASDPVSVAGKQLFARQLRRMKRQEAGSRTGEDIESAHRMRVAIRRMRSLLKLLADHYQAGAVRKLDTGLRDIARALGAVRDLDVFIIDLENFAASQPQAQQAALRELIDRLDRRRARSRRRLNRFLDSKGYARSLRRFNRFCKRSGKGARRIQQSSAPHQLRHVLPALLHQRLSQVKAYDVVLPSPDIEHLHDLRVEFKQLRYALECFQPILGVSAGRFLLSARAMQDLLGRIQDISVFMEAAGQLNKLSPEQSQALALYQAARLAEQKQLRQDFEGLWRAFNRRANQRLFADALLVLR